MKLNSKRPVAFTMFLLVCFSIVIITFASVSLTSYNHEMFFNDEFSFLNGYAVNDFIPVTAVVMVMIGWLCGQSVIKSLQPKKIFSNAISLRQVFLGSIPFFLIITILILFGQQAGRVDITSPYYGVWVFFSHMLSLFFTGGLFLGFSFFLYNHIHEEQKPVSQ